MVVTVRLGVERPPIGNDGGRERWKSFVVRLEVR
jgi:hypothetical protein